MLAFEKVPPGARAAAIIGDSIADTIGKPVGAYAALTFATVTQPSGSDLLNGGGVAYATAIAVTFTHAGRHVFSVSSGDAVNLRQVEVIVWPAASLTVASIRYTAPDRLRDNPDHVKRGILRSLANHATIAGIAAAIEGGTSAPFHGTRPTTLGALTSDNYSVFGGW